MATDAVARGIDASGVRHVVQYDPPVFAAEFDAYARIASAARAGRAGAAASIYVHGAEPKMGNGDLVPLLAAALPGDGRACAELADLERRRSAAEKQQRGTG